MPAPRLLSFTWAAAVAFLLAIFSAVTLVSAQVDPNEKQRYVAAHCPADDYCLTALYSPSDANINYTMIFKGAPTGWRAGESP